MVNERLVWYLEKNGLLAKQQCGYRTNRSTVDHLIRLETFIRDAFIQNQHLVAVFFDLQKAYDTTWKHGIQQDLHDMGLRGNLPIFIGNFLTDRTFQIHLGTILSDVFYQEEGVPQGAILSITLFNVKINDIVKQVDPGVECSLYVDDFVIMYKSPTIDAIQRKLQHTINRLEKWTLRNGFTISKNKAVAMHFCPIKNAWILFWNWTMTISNLWKKLNFLGWFGIQNSPLNCISNISKHGVKNPWTSWKSSLVQNGVQIELHYWNYIAPLLDQY